MLKKELAALLDISPAMVSRLAKQGMPVDTLERAKRWRKRHLEPSRIKGSRFDPNSLPASVKLEEPPSTLVEVARLAVLINSVLANAPDTDFDANKLLQPLRDMLQQLPENTLPRMPLRVWLALVDWVLSEKSALRIAADLEAVLNPDEFSTHTGAQSSGRSWLELACDFSDFSITGFPEVDLDSSDLEVHAAR